MRFYKKKILKCLFNIALQVGLLWYVLWKVCCQPHCLSEGVYWGMAVKVGSSWTFLCIICLSWLENGAIKIKREEQPSWFSKKSFQLKIVKSSGYLGNNILYQSVHKEL